MSNTPRSNEALTVINEHHVVPIQVSRGIEMQLIEADKANQGLLNDLASLTKSYENCKQQLAKEKRRLDYLQSEAGWSGTEMFCTPQMSWNAEAAELPEGGLRFALDNCIKRYEHTPNKD